MKHGSACTHPPFLSRVLPPARTLKVQDALVPNKVPTAAVAAIASAPQNATRAAPIHRDAPPARPARPPSAARKTKEAPETKRVSRVGGANRIITMGSAAPTAKLAADAMAA